MQGVDLSNVNLKHAHFIDANLSQANLTQSNLTRANLSHANLTEILFINSNLFLANLHAKTFDKANFMDAKLNKAYTYSKDRSVIVLDYEHLSDLFSQWINGNKDTQGFIQTLVNSRVNIFVGVLHQELSAYFNSRDETQRFNLDNSNFIGVNLHKISFKNADLRNADFTGSNLREANLRGAKLSESYMVSDDDSDQELYCNYKYSMDDCPKQMLRTILIARGFNLEDQVSTS